jgi:hypothetical protein
MITLNDDGMVINNITQNASLPLAPLSMSNDIETLNGLDFGVDMLAPQDCVAIAQDQDRANRLQTSCNRVGVPILRDADRRFWRSGIEVYYDDVLAATCADDNCIVRITTQP